MNEVTSTLSVDIQSIKVTEVVKDGHTLTFLIESEKVRKRWMYLYVQAYSMTYMLINREIQFCSD